MQNTYVGICSQGWIKRGADISVTFANGDIFGARSTDAGQVSVYKNGNLLGTRDITAWPYYANGGYIGLWFDTAGNALLDDFGGGQTPLNTPAPTQTTTSTGTATATL